MTKFLKFVYVMIVFFSLLSIVRAGMPFFFLHLFNYLFIYFDNTLFNYFGFTLYINFYPILLTLITLVYITGTSVMCIDEYDCEEFCPLPFEHICINLQCFCMK
jgi:hypothetical protein